MVDGFFNGGTTRIDVNVKGSNGDLKENRQYYSTIPAGFTGLPYQPRVFNFNFAFHLYAKDTVSLYCVMPGISTGMDTSQNWVMEFWGLVLDD